MWTANSIRGSVANVYRTSAVVGIGTADKVLPFKVIALSFFVPNEDSYPSI